MTPRTDHVRARVDDYLHDLLDAEESAHVARHCAECPSCGAALDEAQRRLAALQTVPPSEASEDLVQDTVAGVEEHERRRRWWRRSVLGGLATAAAAAAVFLIASHLHYANLSASPTDLKVLGQTRLLAGTAASLRVCLIDRRSGLALSGVHVRIDLRRKATGEVVELGHITTDAEGTGQPKFQVPDWGNADCDLLVTAVGAPGESISYPVKVHRSWQVMLSADKPVYQPGQTILVRSLALRRPDLRPVAGEDVTLTVTDPKGNVIFKHSGKNSAFGIASARCPLADEIIEGQYVVSGRVGDTSSQLVVQVQKYVLPKFKVGVTPDRPYYAPGQTVTATVDAAYFFGQPVGGAAAELTAQAPGQAKPLCQAGARTDGNGRAVFSFDLPKTLIDPGQDEVSIPITAAVTDTAGQKQSRSFAVTVAATPLKIQVVPEAGTLVPGVANTVYVLTTYPDGRPARTQLDGLRPFHDGPLSTDKVGVASFQLTADASGAEFTITATDDAGQRAEKQVRLGYDGRSADFLLRTDKAVYAGGDTATITIVGGVGGPVFVDLLQDGQTLSTATVAMASGRGDVQLDLPPERAGNFQLCAYRVAADGIRPRTTRTLAVRSAQGLQVKATTDQAEYRPGRRARLSFELLDAAGRPARGALSLAAVDEAVFSVLSQAPGSERRYFGADPGPVLPPQAAELPPAERDRLERALIARKAQGAAGEGRRPPRPLDAEELVEAETPAHWPYSLDASTFVAKSQDVARVRYQGLDRVKFGWLLWGLGLVLVGYVLMWVYVRPWYLIAVFHGAGFLFLCATWLFVMVLQEKFSAANKAQATGEAAPPGSRAGADSDRVRQDFPETLLWRPELITDDDGRASLDVDLADSITTWRLTASAVAADGRLGATQAGIKVFQPFFVDLSLPVALTRGDEVTVPVVVYNYLDKPQTVELALAADDWFECLDEPGKKIELAAHAVRSASYRLRVKRVGRHALQVSAKGGEVADAIKRGVEVVPDGRRVEQVYNGSLAQPAEMTLTVPESAIEGSARAFVKIYPSGFSQLVEGLDGIFGRPYGCFEQTSSTTYPNVLALDYLRQTGQAAPEVKDKAERYIHLGYQRLLSFEVAGGGFDWFGHPPANRTLTAYGLMEFRDMAKVYSVDPALIERTRAWLLRQRKADGSWPAERRMINDGLAGSVQRGDDGDLATTAYVAWAVFGGSAEDAGLTRQYLLSHPPSDLHDPYVLALVANALTAIAPDGNDALPYLDRLDAIKKSPAAGLFCWEQPADARTAFYGAGRGGSVETTALATLALLHRNARPETTRGALAWLVKQKDATGTWSSTQATVLALKALVVGTGKPAGDGERHLTLAWDGEKQEVVIPKDQAEVMKLIDLSAGLKPGAHRLTLTDTNGTAVGYQVAFRYHVPEGDGPAKPEALGVQLTYDRTAVRVDETVRATATVTNPGKQSAPMVVAELPVPAGFGFVADDLAALLKDGKIAKYQAGAKGVVVYLRGLAAGQSLELKYGLRATLPAKVSVAPARVYEYYDPDKQGMSAPAQLTTTARRFIGSPSRGPGCEMNSYPGPREREPMNQRAYSGHRFMSRRSFD